MFLHTFFFVVISRYYGVNGADPKKIDAKHIIIDFDVFETLTKPAFIEKLKAETELFLKKISDQRQTG